MKPETKANMQRLKNLLREWSRTCDQDLHDQAMALWQGPLLNYSMCALEFNGDVFMIVAGSEGPHIIHRIVFNV